MRVALIARRLNLAMLALSFGVGITLISTNPLHADVTIKNDNGFVIDIFNTISKADADSISQRAAEFEYSSLFVRLNSTGGDVDAAMRIGRAIRKNEGSTAVVDYITFGILGFEMNSAQKCYSSCALIYIAGVHRSNFGTIGLHRPYFASAPQSRQTIERQAPLMLQQTKAYIQEMGITDSFYQEMVNTEPSRIKLYAGDSIETLVSKRDPTYDEVIISYRARAYGVDTAEMRRRDKDAERCVVQFLHDVRRQVACSESLSWGLSDGVYSERATKRTQCQLSDGESKALELVKRKEVWEHPLFLKRETCFRRIMLGR